MFNRSRLQILLLPLLLTLPFLATSQIRLDSTLNKLKSLKVGQTIDMNSLFDTDNSRRYLTMVDSVPGLDKNELITRLKNWASTSIVSARKSSESETENQLVYVVTINVSCKAGFMKINFNEPHFVRIVAQFKASKYRVLFYDDGIAPHTQVTSVVSRSSYLLNKANEVSLPANLYYEKGQYYQQLLSWSNAVKELEVSIKEYLTKPTSAQNW